MISACILSLNEEQNIPRLIESLKDCDEIIIADGGSTDNTIKLAKSLGATAYLRKDILSVVTQEDIELFRKEFGHDPRFTTDSKFRHAGDIRNEVVTHAKNDWIFMPDADEFVEWNYPEIVDMMKICDSIECDLVQTRDGKSYNRITKLYNRTKTQWGGRIHEVVMAAPRHTRSETMKLHHYPKSNSQAKVTEVLEYCALKDRDSRSLYYLARQYYYEKDYQKSIDMFHRYINKSYFRPEIAHALLIMAKCAWQIEQGDNSRKWCLQAISINPDFREALYDMSIYTGEGQSIYWKRMSEQATDNDVLFINKGI